MFLKQYTGLKSPALITSLKQQDDILTDSDGFERRPKEVVVTVKLLQSRNCVFTVEMRASIWQEMCCMWLKSHQPLRPYPVYVTLLTINQNV